MDKNLEEIIEEINQYKIDNNLKIYENEIWKWVPEYEGHYLVSNMGWIVSYKKNKIKNITKGIKIKDTNGNLMYTTILYKNNKKKQFQVHRLVAEVFCENDNPKEKTIVNHIIERTETECDNRACNLEWVTYQENAKHSSYKASIKNKGNKGYNKTKVRCIETGVVFTSLEEAGKSKGVTGDAIGKAIKSGYKSGGVHWERVDEEKLEPLQLDEEVWKSIEGYPNYEISNLGRVKSLNYHNFNEPRILKQNIHSMGYVMVTLYKNGKSKSIKVHQLVALHFCEGYKEGLVVNHKNHIRNDNRADNLEWITYKENAEHANQPKKQVICLTTKEIFESVSYGSKIYNIKTPSRISYCCKGEFNYAGKLEDGTPLVWRYLDENNNIVFLDKDYEDVEKIAMIDKNTDEVIKLFDTQIEASLYLGKNNSQIINKCLNKKTSIAYGYKWKYIKIKNNFIENANKILKEMEDK